MQFSYIQIISISLKKICSFSITLKILINIYTNIANIPYIFLEEFTIR